MLQIEKFYNKYKGKIIGDHNNKDVGECVSVVQKYQKEQKWPILYGNAIMWQYHGRTGKDGYRFIPRRLLTVPRPSDFAVFDVGRYGHIGIVMRANVLKMEVVNQNWPSGKLKDPVTLTSFNYKNPTCVGFLRKV